MSTHPVQALSSLCREHVTAFHQSEHPRGPNLDVEVEDCPECEDDLTTIRAAEDWLAREKERANLPTLNLDLQEAHARGLAAGREEGRKALWILSQKFRTLNYAACIARDEAEKAYQLVLNKHKELGDEIDSQLAALGKGVIR